MVYWSLAKSKTKLGGGFNTEENFIGDVSQLNIFDYTLSANDIYNLVYSCDHVKGKRLQLGATSERGSLEYIT